MADLLGIGASGLKSSQRALTTTSHNISNANTEGYSRQRVSFGTRIPEYIGVGYAGTGVNVQDVSRNFDNFLATQLRTQTANNERYTSFHSFSSQIDNLMADPDAGLGPMMDEFFAATQGVADNPNSIPARQVMLTSAESLVDRFHYLSDRLSDLNARVNQQLEASVAEVNTLAKGIAEMNEEIALARGKANGRDPNDLMDRRDHLITKLSELVDVRTVEQQDGQMNVFVGTGQGLVVGKVTNELSTRNDPLIQGRNTIVLNDGGIGVDVSRLLKGGKIGGTLDFSNSVLDESRNAIGRIAAGLSEQFNALHEMGLDLDGELGGEFFRSFGPTSYAAQNNNASGEPILAYEDVSQLTTNDYLLEYNGVGWTLSDYKTGQVIPFTGNEVIDGVRIDVSGIAGAQEGDRFLIRPTANAAETMAVAVNNPGRIAAAGALRGSEASDANGMPLNTGTGRISQVTLLENNNPPPFPTIDLEMTYSGGLLNVNPGDAVFVDQDGNLLGDSLSYDPTINGGQTIYMQTADGLHVSFNLSNEPHEGDRFQIGNNSDAVGDNSNALALAALQTKKGMLNGTATFQSTYGQMVSHVGTQTHQASINKDATATLRRQAESDYDSVSGVNLDEEAANLIKFQQAYQANAQVVAISNQLMQTLLQAF